MPEGPPPQQRHENETLPGISSEETFRKVEETADSGEHLGHEASVSVLGNKALSGAGLDTGSQDSVSANTHNANSHVSQPKKTALPEAERKPGSKSRKRGHPMKQVKANLAQQGKLNAKSPMSPEQRKARRKKRRRK